MSIVELRTLKHEGSIRQELVLKADSLDHLHPDASAAIREIQVTKKKGLVVRLHDKMAALLALAKHLGLFSDHAASSSSYAPLSAKEEKQRVVSMFLDAMQRESSAAVAQVDTQYLADT